jgi:hypothetical protein
VNFSQIAETVSNALDFSRWEQENDVPREVITDLGLTGDEIVVLQAQQFGLSEKLASSFGFLKTKQGKTKSLLRASISFEHLNRDCSYEQLAQALGVNNNTAYRHGCELREAYEKAFGINLTSTGDGLHLVSLDEVQIQNDRVLANFEKHILPSLQKFGKQLNSLKQTNQQFSLTGRTQALLKAVTDDVINS